MPNRAWLPGVSPSRLTTTRPASKATSAVESAGKEERTAGSSHSVGPATSFLASLVATSSEVTGRKTGSGTSVLESALK